MAVKIGSLNKWRQLPPGSVLEFPAMAGAHLRIEFNTEADTRVDAIDEKNKATFVATIRGNDTVQFTTDGPVSVQATSEGEVWYSTGDGQGDYFDLTHLKDLKGLEMRGERNPQLEKIMLIAQQNQLRTEAALAESRRLYEEMKASQNGQVSAGNASGTEQQAAAAASAPPAQTTGTAAGATAGSEANASGPAAK